MLKLENFIIKFNKNDQQEVIVSIDSFSIKKGEIVALLGESGSGKSITSLAIMGLLPNQAKLDKNSKIYFNSNDISELSELQLRKIRGKRIAMIFQEPMTALNPVMTVGQQVAEVLSAHKLCAKASIYSRVIELFKQVELPRVDSLFHAYPHQLSGGMKQRVMIAMALAGEPELLIADEPTSALDVMVQYEIIQLLKKLQQQYSISILFITHNVSILNNFADRIAILYAGSLMETGETQKILTSAFHPYTQELLQCLPDLSKRGQPLALIKSSNAAEKRIYEGCKFYYRCGLHRPECKKFVPLLQINSNHTVACILYNNFQQAPVKCSKKEKVNRSQLMVTNKEIQCALELKGGKVYFPIKKGFFKRTKSYVKAVDDVSFKLEKGKTTAIVGESGCGKTTLAKAILGLIPFTAGTININDIAANVKGKMFHKYLQMIFQDPFSSLNPRMLVGDIIVEGMRALKIGDRNYQQERVNLLLQQMELPKNSASRYPHEFSGGQRQRICIARALAVEPQVLVCDEPTSALDLSVQAQIINLLKSLQEEQKLTYLFITHDIALVAYFADEIIVMKQGKIVEQNTALELLKNPKDSYTKKLIEHLP